MHVKSKRTPEWCLGGRGTGRWGECDGGAFTREERQATKGKKNNRGNQYLSLVKKSRRKWFTTGGDIRSRGVN